MKQILESFMRAGFFNWPSFLKGREMNMTRLSDRLSSRRLQGLALAGALASAPMLAFAGATVDHIKSTGTLTLGFASDAAPFSFTGDGPVPSGYAAGLCVQVAERIKSDLNLPDLKVTWVPEDGDAGLAAVKSGTIDLLCTPVGVTATRRQDVSFTLPIFPGGTGVMLRTDMASSLGAILQFGEPTARPIWRGSPARTFLNSMKFSVVKGTISEDWLTERVKTLQLTSVITAVDTYDAGAQAVSNGTSDAFFGQMPGLLDRAKNSANSGKVVVLPRQFTHEALALPLARSDEDFRLVVDRALSDAIRGEGFHDFYLSWFNQPNDSVMSFLQQSALPD